MKDKVKRILEDNGVDYLPELNDVFHNIQSFLGLETKYQQTSYYRNKMKLLVSDDMKLLDSNKITILFNYL